jgi:threonine dehydratase
LIDGSLVADLSSVAEALRLMITHNHVVAEGAGACPVACALSGDAGAGKNVCIVSGGNIDFSKLSHTLNHEI